MPDNLEKNIIAILLPAMALLMLAVACCRHLFPECQNVPLAAAGACLTWIASLGMARAAALGLHTRVAAAETFTRDATRKRLAILADAAFLLFAALTFAIGLAVIIAAVRNPNAPGHPLVYAALPIGSLLTIIRLVQRLRRAFGERQE